MATKKTVIATSLGITDLPAVKQKKIVDGLENTIQRKIVLSTLEKINSSQMIFLEKLLEINNPALTTLFLKMSVPDLPSLANTIAKSTVDGFKSWT